MNQTRIVRVLTACLFVLAVIACKPQVNEAQKVQEQPPIAVDVSKPAVDIPKEVTPEAITPPDKISPKPAPPQPVVAIEVDGTKLTKADLDQQVKKRLDLVKANVPPDKVKEISASIRKQVIDEFILRTILTNEVSRQKITVTEKEIDEAIEELAKSLPPGRSIDEILKKNKISRKQMRDDLRVGLQVNKLIMKQMGTSLTADQEIKEFYTNNLDQFKIPASVHARHILIAFKTGDDQKIKLEKKSKAEKLRRQLIEGADFAEIALKNSDCPSRAGGGDLGQFHRGQMVKTFEDAAFTQKIKEIGPPVETEFGWHIIQVIERKEESIVPLDDTLKPRIAAFLQQEKKQKTFDVLVGKLRAKAKIAVHGE